MNYPVESLRSQQLRFFRYFYGKNDQVGSLLFVPLPSFTNAVVNEICSSKAVPRELTLLGFLPTLSVADRGRTRIAMSNGSINSLSIFVVVGAESGAGKSRSLEEALAFFTEWESEKEKVIFEKNKAHAFANLAIGERIKVLMREFAKKGDAEVFRALQELNNAKAEMIPLPELLLNDVTEAAYTQHLVSKGMAMRLESDGILPPKKAMRVMTKAWSSESSDRKRMTSPDGAIKDPFVVDLVMTQPEFFAKFVSDREFLKSGLLGRTLVYQPQTRLLSSIPSRPMKEDDRKAFRMKLRELLEASEQLEHGEKPRRIIQLSPEAERVLEQRQNSWLNEAAYGGRLYRVSEFVSRLAQHAIRLAGCLYLAEFPAESKEPLPRELMHSGISMAEVFLSHTLRWTIKDYEDVNAECCRAIMLHILEKNFSEVLETELKQAIRYQYDAADVNVALHYLQMQGHLQEVVHDFCWVGGKRKRGRPAGRTFRNPYYAPFEPSF